MKVTTTTIPTRLFFLLPFPFLSFSFPFSDCKVPLCKVATFFLCSFLAVLRDLMYGVGILAWLTMLA
jgi:hypothetical protein